MVVNEGLNYILGVTFSDEVQDATHYVGLKGTGTVAAGDTIASHAGWSEITAYADDRKAWVEGGASGQSISNTGNAAAFAINGAAEVYGAFLCATASGTAQELICAVDFASNRTLASGDTLNVCKKRTLRSVMGVENSVNSGNTLTSDVEGNPEPSLMMDYVRKVQRLSRKGVDCKSIMAIEAQSILTY